MKRLFLLATLGLSSTTLAAEKPNLVILLADDMGYGDLGANNPDSKIPTPHLDRLAREGMRFTDAHAAACLCTPSRYALLTGRYPFRHASGAGNRAAQLGPVIEPGRLTLASLLKQRGYTTAMVGKWHLGFEGGLQFDYSKPLRGGPLDRGFDWFFGIHASTDIPPYFYIQQDRVVTVPTSHVPAHNTPDWSPIQGAFWREGPIAPDLKLEEVLPEFTRRAADWIGEHRRSEAEEPFFLYVALTAPHTPWLPAAKFVGLSKAGLYGDFVAHVDDSAGRILTALEQNGYRDNTLIFFTSDNGPVWYPVDTQRLGHSATGVYRGMKGDAWEGGHRMPFAARWPGRIPAGSVCDQTVCFTDLMATFAALTGVNLPANAGEDSVNILPLLLAERREQPIREATVVTSSGGVRSIRQGDWKLIPALGSGGFSRPEREAPLPGGPAGQLYNLAADPSEQNNRWQQEPEVVERLTGLLQQHTQ